MNRCHTKTIKKRRAINARVGFRSVALGCPSDLSKSTEVRLTKSCLSSATYKIRTKSAKSRGLEKNGGRERILGLG